MADSKALQKILFILLAFVLVAYAADPVAVVIKSRGKVKMYRTATSQAETVKKGSVLYDGYKLQTSRGSFCALKFIDDKSLLRMKENSSCVIEGKREKDRIDKNIVVEVGSFFASLFRQRGRFTVTTPTSVASVKGTKFWTVQFPSGKTVYIGVEGLIDLINDAGRVLLRSGQTAVVTSSNELPTITLTKEGDIPADEDKTEDLKTLEIEFKDATGNVKKLRLDYQEK